MTDNVVALLSLDRNKARELLDHICSDSRRVIFVHHAKGRMKERDVSKSQVINCLSKGIIVEGPAREPGGGWRFKMEVRSAGDVISVVAALDHDGDGNVVIVITSYVRKK